MKTIGMAAVRHGVHGGIAVTILLCVGCLDVKDDGLARGGKEGCEYCHTELSERGAHAAHLYGEGDFVAKLDCDECHPVPAKWYEDGRVHEKLGIDFPSDGIAAADGADPEFDEDSQKCSNVHCHGGGLSGGDRTEPEWEDDEELADGVSCGDCHGIPPSDGHPEVSEDSCEGCHGGGYADGELDPETHVDGETQFSARGAASERGLP